ncbi:hypothetical protein VP01_9547g1, partial [Puccinia sorghi]
LLPLEYFHTSHKENIWHVQAYLDLLRLCHFCKKACSSSHESCTGRQDQFLLTIPLLSVGNPTHPQAGRPTGQAATVARVAEGSLFPPHIYDRTTYDQPSQPMTAVGSAQDKNCVYPLACN